MQRQAAEKRWWGELEEILKKRGGNFDGRERIQIVVNAHGEGKNNLQKTGPGEKKKRAAQQSGGRAMVI